jgi:hypothetical protein
VRRGTDQAGVTTDITGHTSNINDCQKTDENFTQLKHGETEATNPTPILEDGEKSLAPVGLVAGTHNPNATASSKNQGPTETLKTMKI